MGCAGVNKTHDSLAFLRPFPYQSGMVIDIVVGLVILASALISFMRGFIREVLTIAGVVGGVLAAIFIGPAFVPTMRSWFGIEDGKDPGRLFDIIPMDIVAYATAYGIIFIAVVIVLSVASHLISGAAKAMGLGPVDRTLGVIFGVARALVLLGLFYLPFHIIMKPDRKEEVFKDSHSFYIVEKISDIMASYLPESDDIKQDVKETTDDLIKKRLEEQNLLGAPRKDTPAPAQEGLAPAPEQGEGYKEEQRETLDKLFSEPAINE